jgi:hypothetical protein
MMLKPHLRAADHSKQQIDVHYGDANDRLDVYARMFRALKFLDMVQTHAGERFAWPRSFKVELRTCGEANAHWSGRNRTLHLCYELADEFAELYLNYGRRSGAKVRPKR